MICRITPSVPQFGMVHEFSLSRGGSSILTLGGWVLVLVWEWIHVYK